jgi:hypothetical protein
MRSFARRKRDGEAMAPKFGIYARALYDVRMENKGACVGLPSPSDNGGPSKHSTVVDRLRMTYELEIEARRRGGETEFRLDGENVGGRYVEYAEPDQAGQISH